MNKDNNYTYRIQIKKDSTAMGLLRDGYMALTSKFLLYIPGPYLKYHELNDKGVDKIYGDKDFIEAVYVDSKNINESGNYTTVRELYLDYLAGEMIRFEYNIKEIEERMKQKLHYKELLEKYSKKEEDEDNKKTE